DSAVVEGRPVWVIDGTNWPRPAARASVDRTWEYRPLPGWPQNGVVPAWSYQWLAAVPETAGSWVLPLEVRRRGPTAKSATQVALDQITAVRRAQNPDAPTSSRNARQRLRSGNPSAQHRRRRPPGALGQTPRGVSTSSAARRSRSAASAWRAVSVGGSRHPRPATVLAATGPSRVWRSPGRC